MSRLFLVEDDLSLVDGLTYSLKKNGFEVEVAHTVWEAVSGISMLDKYDLLIFLTASDEEVNIIRGLDSGGDDYITKPFRLGELCSRIRALLRRTKIEKDELKNILSCGDITIDLIGCRVSLRGRVLELTGAEYRLLCFLVKNAGKIVSRDHILNELWDDTGNFVDDNTLSVYIRRLREKVESDASHPQHLVTVRGFGYQWKEVCV